MEKERIAILSFIRNGTSSMSAALRTLGYLPTNKPIVRDNPDGTPVWYILPDHHGPSYWLLDTVPQRFWLHQAITIGAYVADGTDCDDTDVGWWPPYNGIVELRPPADSPQDMVTLIELLKHPSREFVLNVFEKIDAKGWNAIDDIPFMSPGWYVPFNERYKNAKNILTVRDSNEWYDSVLRLFAGDGARSDKAATAVFFDVPAFTEEHRKLSIMRYEAHNQQVIDYFKAKPEKLLVLKLPFNDNSWKPLCNFLDKEVPTVSFPWLHATRQQKP